MKIEVNGDAQELEARDLEAALAELGYASDAPVATALNGEFVAREARAETRLADGDRVEVISPRMGG